MSLDPGNKYEIRRRALLEAIRFCGGVATYSRRLNISRTRASNWRNHPEIAIPYEYAVLTEDITQVSIERLSPFTKITNKVIRRLRSRDKPLNISMQLDEILIGDRSYFGCFKEDRPIIVGTDGVLISGLTQIEAYKRQGKNQVLVVVLDLEALLLEVRKLQSINIDFVNSEKIAIGLRLQQLMGNRQNQLSVLDSCSIKKGSVNDSNTPLSSICYEVVGRKDQKIAEMVGFNSKDTYIRAKRVCLCGIAELIEAMDCKKISIAKAAKIARLLKNQQLDQLQNLGLLLRNNIDA